jgi:PAS domain S-box-containing protein
MKNEPTLLRDEKFTETLLKTVGALVIVMSSKGEVIFFNVACQSLFGYSEGEVLGRYPWDFMLPDFNPAEAKDVFANLASGNLPEVCENVCLTRDGTLRDISWTNTTVLHADGTVRIVIATGIDITERKQAEAELLRTRERTEKHLDIAEAIIVALDDRGRVKLINRRGCSVLGYDEDELVGKSWIDIAIPEDQRDAMRSVHSQVVRGEIEPLEHYENDVLTRDGRRRTIAWHNVFERDRDGAVTGSLSSGQDITERKSLEEQIRRSQLMEAIGQLAGGIAHDFNNLLGVMIGNAEMLANHIGEDEQARRNILTLIDAVDRGASLTSRLLAFSRQQALSPQLTAINDLVSGLAEILQRSLGESIELSTDLRSEIGNVMIDQHQFENALINLSFNARDAMPKGGALTIVTSRVTLDDTYAAPHEDVAPGEYVKITVADSGGGMTPDVLGKAFEPFFTTKDVGKGSGLGLSMVYGFIKQSQGHVTISSEPGHGTKVDLFLPCAPTAAVRVEPGIATADCATDTERILVVEDNPAVREIPVTILRNQGYEVVEAGNGEEAISALRNGGPFDILFTDIVLPGGMNGMDIAEQAVQIQPGIKVLYTTGYAKEHNVQKEAQVTEIRSLSKPYRRAELLKTVKAVLGRENA